MIWEKEPRKKGAKQTLEPPEFTALRFFTEDFLYVGEGREWIPMSKLGHRRGIRAGGTGYP